MCRTCNPEWSSLLEKENQTLKIFNKIEYQYAGFDHVNIGNIEKLYVAGGEPTIMPELYKFLEDCIEKKETTFEIHLNTNAVVLTKQFKLLLKHFNNVIFIISVDGYGLVNQYIRWPTKWEKLIDNIDYLYNQGHCIGVNLVVSIYSISSLYSTIDFLSSRYKKISIGLCPVDFKDNILSPYLFPNKELIISNLEKIKKLDMYNNDLVLKSKIDEYLDYFENRHVLDLPKLAEFFEYNDKLDISRNVKLIDYIPKLDQCRNYIRE
jgi:sulfatase maturation enzyme AslB (radical SAM superfamily)